MATSYIAYKEKGFWSNDTFVELSVDYIIKTFQAKSSETQWIKDYIDQWLFHIAKGNFLGFIDLGFDKYLIDENRVTSFIDLIRETKSYLLTKGDWLSHQELNLFIVHDKLQSRWSADLPTDTISKTLDKLELLLLGEWPSQDEVAIWKA
ncbi:hypothetical protein QNI16_13805 [Cytophagaceae bacterium YF14B1]|uniref:Uncharacterized protein n=1 Tax=Xanthocytophaga flava TaxID=3048013 RepID=A0AAE3QRN1_9BACT|nr:hypothetical protein [Xanthocytophaga flavus]MDJ1481569.1 hypothetical protein [Xanthocytophaga flavus]